MRMELLKKEEQLQANKSLNLKKDDYYPYSDKAFDYWTGYYSSRSRLK